MAVSLTIPELPTEIPCRFRLSEIDPNELSSDPELAAALSRCRLVRVTKGGLVRERVALESSGNYLVVVRSGRLRAFLATEEDELTLGYLVAGSVLTSEHDFQVEVEEDAELLVATYQPNREKSPPIVGSLLKIVGMLAFESVHSRVCGFLLHVTALGTETPDGTLVQLKLSEERIAQMLGTRRQTVSSTLTDLARAGLIELVGRGQILVRDLDGLRRAAASR
jgi:CRP-like cAMP-binding protein